MREIWREFPVSVVFGFGRFVFDRFGFRSLQRPFAKLVTRKCADKSDFLALLLLFVLQLKRDLLSFFYYKLYNLWN